MMKEREKNRVKRDFPHGPVVKTPCFHCRGMGSIPGWGTKILNAMRHSSPKKEGKKE